MSTQPPRSYTTLAIAIVVAAMLLGSVAYLTISLTKTVTKVDAVATPFTVTETSLLTTTVTTTRSTSQANITACSVAVPPPQGIYLRVVNDSGSPVSGLPVIVQSTANTFCGPGHAPPPTDSIADTNSSGWLLFQGWLYYFVFVYAGGTYNFTVGGDPMAWSVATINVPSGSLTTEICGLGGGAASSSCSNSSTTVVSSTSSTTASTVSALLSVTGTSVATESDTYLTSCSVTGVGGLQLQVVSDSTGEPVSGEVINAVDRLGCDIVGQSGETQVVYLDNFTIGQGGWLTPVFPNQATPGGELTFTVGYQGETFNFSVTVPPIGTSCITLHVPSGNITTATVMNGQGSYCWQ